MDSWGSGESGYTFWVVDGQTRVDTDQLLAANAFLREACSAADRATQTANLAFAAASATAAVDPNPRVAALAEVLRAATLSLTCARDLLVRLLFWRERAAQIYEVAEMSVSGFFDSCRVAEYARCGQGAAFWQQRLAGVPWVGGALLGAAGIEALSTYKGVIGGTTAGVGAESLQMQVQMGRVSGFLYPYVVMGNRLMGGAAADGGEEPTGRGETGAAARSVAASFRGMRRVTGADTNGVLLMGRVDASSPPVFALAALGAAGGRGASTDGTRLYPGPAAGKGWDKAGAVAGQVMGAGAVSSARPPREAVTPLRADQVLRQMQKNAGHGEIEIVRHSGSGGPSWSVLVRGTKEWSPLSQSPHDLLTNLDEIAGDASDQRQAVVAAMELAGIGSSDPVELVGHSQGGIVVANLAADPDVTRQFNVVSVLTAGSPVGGTPALTGNARMLSLENLRDIVPGLDGQSNPQGPNNLTVYFDAVSDPREARVPPDGPGGSHDKSVYAAAAGALEDGAADESVADFLDHRRTALRLDAGTTSTVLHFRTQRVP